MQIILKAEKRKRGSALVRIGNIDREEFPDSEGPKIEAINREGSRLFLLGILKKG